MRSFRPRNGRVSAFVFALTLGVLAVQPALAQEGPAAPQEMTAEAPQLAQESVDPASPEGIRREAEARFEAGDRKGAITLYQSLVQQQPDNYDAWMRLGRLLGWESRYDDALAAYDKALELSPGNKDTRLEIAQVYAWKGDTKRSLELYQEVVNEEPGNRDARLGLARTLAWSNRFRESGDLYRSMISSNGGDIEARLGMAQVQSWDDRFDEALVAYREVLAKEPDNLEARLGEARVIGWRGDQREAVALYRGIVKDHPESSEAHQGLGEARAWQGMDGEALDELRTAVKLDTNNSEARESLKALETAHKVELAPMGTVARDSDTNELSLAGTDLSFDANPQNRVRLTYRHFGTYNEKADATGHADLFIAGLTSRISPEVTLRTSIGAASLNPQGNPHDQQPVGAVSVQFQPSPKHSLNVGYSRDVLLETPQLIANSLAVDTIDAGYSGALGGGNNVSVGYSRSTYSDKNTSNLYQASFAHTVMKNWPMLKVGYNQKFIEYDRQTFNGYFSPPTFQQGEAFVELDQHDPKKRWIYWLGAGAGYQKIYGESSQFVYRVSAGIGRRIGDWGSIELGGLTSNSAISSVAGYRYNAGTLRMNMRF